MKLMMMLKVIHSRFSGIQTHDLCLATDAPSPQCKECNFQVVGFKMIRRICLMIADRYQQSIPRPFKESEACN